MPIQNLLLSLFGVFKFMQHTVKFKSRNSAIICCQHQQAEKLKSREIKRLCNVLCDVACDGVGEQCCVWLCEWCCELFGGCWCDGMIDFMLFWGFEDRLTDRLTNERTFVLLESLSRLKTENIINFVQVKDVLHHYTLQV